MKIWHVSPAAGGGRFKIFTGWVRIPHVLQIKIWGGRRAAGLISISIRLKTLSLHQMKNHNTTIADNGDSFCVECGIVIEEDDDGNWPSQECHVRITESKVMITAQDFNRLRDMRIQYANELEQAIKNCSASEQEKFNMLHMMFRLAYISGDEREAFGWAAKEGLVLPT